MNESDSTETHVESLVVESVIAARVRDLVDGFKVRRVLPAPRRRMVGPFIFLDQMGPEILSAGQGLDVAPHPHIGLATVTYMFSGSLLHRDSLGSVQRIDPGELNLMTAGRGIAHSERTPQEHRAVSSEAFGLQAWVALRHEQEECAPSFAHHPSNDVPLEEWDGVNLRMLMGSISGVRSPIDSLPDLFYADVTLASGARLPIAPEYEERGVYIVKGEIVVEGDTARYAAGNLVVLAPGAEVIITTGTEARVMLLGGAPMEGPRHIYWNFVSSSRERIEQAKEDWMAGRFERVPGETEWIPLPGAGPAIVRYP